MARYEARYLIPTQKIEYNKELLEYSRVWDDFDASSDRKAYRTTIEKRKEFRTNYGWSRLEKLVRIEKDRTEIEVDIKQFKGEQSKT